MTATNHALTGACLGLLVGDPWIALPAAVISHFICDALPHFDRPAGTTPNKWFVSVTFHKILIADASCCILLVAWLAFYHPSHWLLAAICAFLATSPDLLWINRFLKARRGQPWRASAFAKFAERIQWFARPIGAVVEVTWFVTGLIILIPLVHS
jgi:uncharacterized membrane protein